MTKRNDNEPTLQYAAFIWQEHLTPEGHLPREKAAEACCAWWFASNAIGMLERVPESVVLEGDTDPSVRLWDLAEACRIQYGLPDLECFMNLMPAVRSEAFRCNHIWPSRFQAWLDSGGRAYNTLTREEGALNKNDH